MHHVCKKWCHATTIDSVGLQLRGTTCGAFDIGHGTPLPVESMLRIDLTAAMCMHYSAYINVATLLRASSAT
jgi:hypothetical protein